MPQAFLTRTSFIKITTVLLGIGMIGYLWQSGAMDALLAQVNQAQIAVWVEKAGYWGPLIIIGLMTVAVVASPIPSAPIAIAAGVAYGQIFGTFYVIFGAFVGALIAFFLARLLGRKAIKRWFGENIDKGLLGSQNALTAMVFFSRLLPFVSFDMISYAAGLSAIQPWRFALATLFGVIPIAFLLAHLGEMAVVGDGEWAMWFSVVLGAFVALPVLFVAYRKLRPVEM